MSNYNNLKTTIDANIKQNGNQEITGPILNSVLNQMVNILGTGYQFAGVATLDPATDPGTPDAKVFYIANGKGTYTNFGGLEVTEDEVVVLYWDSAWHKVATGIASQAKLSELESNVLPLKDFTEVTNSVVNGDFSKGSTKWNVYGGTAQFVNNECSVTNNNGVSTMSIRHADKIAGFVVGHKYFVFAQVEADSNVQISFYVGSKFTELYELKANQKAFISFEVEPTSNAELGFYVKSMVGVVTAKWSYIGLVDMSELSDVSLSECLAFSPNKWFDGTIYLTDLLTLKNNRFVNQKKKFIVASSDSINKNIADYICDGKNDEEEINKAINSLPSDGGTIELLSGTFILNLPIYPKMHTRIVGQGEGTILKVADGIKKSLTANAIAGYNNFAVDNIDGLLIGMDIAIFSDSHMGYNNGESKIITAINPTSKTITVDSVFKNSYTMADNAYIVSAYNAIDCYDVSNVTIENLTIDGNRANNFEGNYDEWQNGVYLKRSHNSVVRNCIIRDCMQVGICSGHIDNVGSGSCTIINNLISGCRFNAIHVHGMYNSVICENIVSHGTQSVIYTIDTKNVEIANNVVLEGENDGIMILSSQHINMIGNTIKNVANNGITISSTASYGDCESIHVNGALIHDAKNGIKLGAKHSIVSNCSIAGVSEYGIISAISEYCQIANNNVSRPDNAGIFEYEGANNTIIGNSVYKTTYGYGIASVSAKCLVTSNVIKASVGNMPISVTGADSISVNNLIV